MAKADTVYSLFGMKSPQEVAREQMLSSQKLLQSQQDPYARLGTALGMGLGRLFGGTSPEMERSRQFEQILAQSRGDVTKQLEAEAQRKAEMQAQQMGGLEGAILSELSGRGNIPKIPTQPETAEQKAIASLNKRAMDFEALAKRLSGIPGMQEQAEIAANQATDARLKVLTAQNALQSSAQKSKESEANIKKLDAQAKYYQAQATAEGLPPEEIQLFKTYLDLPEDQKKVFLNNFMSSASDLPKDVQTYLFWNNLPADKQKAFLQLKRTNQVINTGDQIQLLDADGSVAQTFNIRPKPGETAEHKAAVAVAETEAQAVAQAQIDLPTLTNQTTNALDLINNIKTNKALSQVVGAGAYNPFTKLRGSPAQALLGDIQRLEGQVFLQAYAQLRGAQGITDIEGEKATQAIANLSKAQGPEDYVKRLEELEAILREELVVVQSRAEKPIAGEKQVLKYNRQTGEFE